MQSRQRLARVLLAALIIATVSYYVLESLQNGERYANYITTGGAIVCQVSPLENSYQRGWFRTFFDGKFYLSNYPPFYYICATTACHLAGKNWTWMVLLTNSFYLLPLILFSYLLGKELKDDLTGLCMALLVLLYPLTYFGFITFCSDFALMGIQVMCLYLLIKSRFFEKTGWSVLFGIGAGIGMMVKDPFGAFIIGPVSVGAANVVYRLVKKKFTPAGNFLLFTIVFLLVISPYYGDPSIVKFVLNRPLSEPDPNPWYSFWKLRLYTVGLIDSQLSLPFFLAVLPGILPFLRLKNRKIRWSVLSWIIVPNLILIFMPHWSSVRYLLPVQPAFALITALWLGKMVRNTEGKAFFCLLVAIGLFQHYYFQFGSPGRSVYGKMEYFNLSRWEIASSDSFRRENSALLEGIERGLLREEPKLRDTSLKERLKLLVVSEEGDTSWIAQVLCYGYFWFNNIPLDVRTSVSWYQYYPQSLSREMCGLLYIASTGKSIHDPFLASKNKAVLEEWNRQRASFAIPFQVVQNIREGYSGITTGQPERDRDCTAQESEWNAWMGELEYRGVIYQDENYKIHFFKRKTAS
ncbi:MAG: ArnT family glycosyltransferase [Endomicrobiales bacterium]